MEMIEKLILWILLSSCASLDLSIRPVAGGRVLLNGPSIQTADLRAIDGYVASGLPLFADTHGFVLHSGMRPVIVKVKDPNKVIRDGIEQPNTSYYRDLPSVIPEGFEGVASSSFLLGNPIPPSRFYAPSAGPVVSFTQPLRLPANNQGGMPFDPDNRRRQDMRRMESSPQQVAQPSIRVENRLMSLLERRNGGPNQDRSRNPVVQNVSEFESNLPMDYRNPFYRDAALASMLADQSLIADGEELVQEWNTNKIREGRVRDLLSGAGLI